MKPEDLQSSPKLFCENIRVGFTKEHFVLGLSSGDDASVYALSPAHIKRLRDYLAHEITQYEKEHGEIEAKWNPSIVSPVQNYNPPPELS